MAVLGIDTSYIRRLVEQNERAQKDMRPFRRFFRAVNQAYVGANYSIGGSKRKKPLNQTAMYISIMLRQLVATSPQVFVTTPHLDLKSVATLLELHVNHSIKNIELPTTIRLATLNALMLCAQVRMGLSDAGTVRIDNADHVVGQVFVDNISPHDYIVDMQAQTYGERQFEACRLLIPRTQILANSDLLTAELFENLKPGMPSDVDAGGELRTASMSREQRREERLEEEIAVWEFYIPRQQLIILLPENPDKIGEVQDTPIAIRKWTGPKRGPYHRLSFDPVADNIMPKSPLSDGYDLDDLINRLAVKQFQQAERQKQNVIVPGGHQDSAKIVSNAPDGAAISLADPSKVTQAIFGGVDPRSSALLLQLIQEYSRQAGNPDLMGGLGPQSKTARQDELLNENINKRLDDMRRSVVKFVAGISEDVAWYAFTDPLLNSSLELRSASGMTSIPVTFTANDIRGSFLQYNFAVNPYSMQEATPSGQLQLMTTVFQQAIAPFAQALATQGMAINFRGYLEAIAKYANMPELNQILMYQPMPEPQAPESAMPASTKPAVTSRTYERVNRPGATSQGKRSETVKILMGAGSQDAELAQVGAHY